MIPSYYDAPDISEGSVPMRGDDRQTGWMFSYVSPEERVPADHPLRPIRRMTDAIFDRLSPRFDRLYSTIGRPSIPPEKLLRALLLQGLYTVRSERLLMEQLRVQPAVSLVRRAWAWTTRCGTRRRSPRIATGCSTGDIAKAFFRRSAGRGARRAGCSPTSTSPSTARCSRRGRARRVSGGEDAPPDAARRSRAIRRSISAARSGRTTRISRRPIRTRGCIKKSTGSEAKLAYLGHLLTENRHGLIVDALVTPATGTAEREAALAMLGDLPDGGRITRRRRQELRHARLCSRDSREMGVTPHVAQYPETTRRGSAIDARTTRHPGYEISQRKRKLVEQAFGWMKTVGLMRKLHHRGGPLVDWNFTFPAAAYNLVRLRRLLAQPV